jgi:hypothetical protein
MLGGGSKEGSGSREGNDVVAVDKANGVKRNNNTSSGLCAW